MPPHHQYFGTPLTTFILNVLYSSKFSDIHCGMRGMSGRAQEHADQLPVVGDASEIVLKSVQMGLRTTEVPMHFLKDQGGASATTNAWDGSRRSRPRGSTCGRCSSTAPTSSW